MIAVDLVCLAIVPNVDKIAPRDFAGTPLSYRCLIVLPSIALRTWPFGPNSFRPFHCAGLWLAVICTPPAAFR